MPTAEDLSRAQSGDWIARQPEGFRRALLDIAVWRHVEAGTTINRAADETGGIWGLARGQIDVASALGVAGSPPGDINLPGHWGGIGPIFGLPRGADGTARVARWSRSYRWRGCRHYYARHQNSGETWGSCRPSMPSATAAPPVTC